MNNVINSFKFKNILSPNIWQNAESSDFSNVKLNPEVRKHLLDITETFIESLGTNSIDLHDVVLVGSICNYNWSQYSDIDIHLVADIKSFSSNANLAKEFFDTKKKNFTNNHNITVKKFDVEMYVQDVDEVINSKGIYSILFNKWLSEPNKNKRELDKESILSKVKQFYHEFAKIKKGGSAAEKIKKIDALKAKIKKYRQAGLDKSGEYGVENMVFKYLRRVGFIEDVNDLKYTLLDKNLSLENA
jgi:hypothetical protein